MPYSYILFSTTTSYTLRSTFSFKLAHAFPLVYLPHASIIFHQPHSMLMPMMRMPSRLLSKIDLPPLRDPNLRIPHNGITRLLALCSMEL